MGGVGVKVYDKFSRVLRMKTNVNDLSFFKHHSKVEHKYQLVMRELAPLKKSISDQRKSLWDSLIGLRESMCSGSSRKSLMTIAVI
ncbi:hypothetical protein [Propionivibrio sp.]|uniref:hypothetical protein n=1 Tax=Propionivibrio sp. TaxID=2212460 RepID=UPI0025F5FCFF|nr:hypothetical protein [Propionivibrio sp.]